VLTLLMLEWRDGRAKAKAGREAVAAAQAALPAVIGYDYRTLDADFAKAEKYLADYGKGPDGKPQKLLTNFKTTTSKSVADAANRYKVTIKADVVSSGVLKVDSPSTVTVLVFADQTVTNTKLKAPRIDRNRIRVQLHKMGGQWKIVALDPL
jgi:Mce-associated membrane protein